MSRKNTISVYFAIIRKLRSGGASFYDILKYIDNGSLTGEFFEMSQRTFQRYINDIHDIFSIEIRFNKSKGLYFISEDITGIQQRVFESFDLLHALNIKNRLEDFIQLETKEIQNTNFIPAIVDAIKHQNFICFSYRKFRDNSVHKREVEPYLLKEYHNRWFVLAKDKKDNVLKTFALDRMETFTKTDLHFLKDQTINPSSYFEHAIGIITPNQSESQKPQNVMMKVSSFQRKYLESLPLHKSQKITTNNKGENILTMYVYITHDLEMEILALGENVMVIEPKQLLKRITNRLTHSISNYK